MCRNCRWCRSYDIKKESFVYQEDPKFCMWSQCSYEVREGMDETILNKNW